MQEIARPFFCLKKSKESFIFVKETYIKSYENKAAENKQFETGRI